MEYENDFKGFERSDDVVEEELASSCTKLSVIRNYMDDVISYIGASADPEVLAHYRHFWQFL
jgi:hypothetical protein